MSEEERLLKIFHKFFMDVQNEFLELWTDESRCIHIRKFIKDVRNKL